MRDYKLNTCWRTPCSLVHGTEELMGFALNSKQPAKDRVPTVAAIMVVKRAQRPACVLLIADIGTLHPNTWTIKMDYVCVDA
jgi:hypothetical protein